jgi:phytoene synthase
VTVNAEEAYAQCERITWEQARNFAYGIRLLPPDKRRSLAAVYALARRIDDIGDGDLPAAEKTARLEAARAQVLALAALARDNRASSPDSARQDGAALEGAALDGAALDRAGLDSTDPVLVALADTGLRFDLPLEAFGELIDGCLADVNRATYATFDDLLWYCRCVAGSIGRLSLGIYGAKEPDQQARLADDLGVALQLTNILRDVREDFLNNRIYLPAEDLDRFGIEFAPFGSPEPFPTEVMQARFASLVEFEAARAREWYGSGLRLLATIDRRSAACTGAMAGIYRRLLDRIDRNPDEVLRGRMSLPSAEKALVAAQALAGFDRWKHRGGPGGRSPVRPGVRTPAPDAAVGLSGHPPLPPTGATR